MHNTEEPGVRYCMRWFAKIMHRLFGQRHKKSYREVILEMGPVAYYPLDEDVHARLERLSDMTQWPQQEEKDEH